MKNIFVIHGYNGDTLDTFGPYVEAEAKKRNLVAVFPVFPPRELATYKSWSKVLDAYKSGINEDTILVAHSLGTQFIPRYVAENNLPIGLYISLAGFLQDHSGREDLQKVISDFKPSNDQIDSAIGLMKSRYAVYSDTDHLNPLEELERYADRYKAQRVFVPNIGHMGKKSGVKEIPQVMEIVDRYS